MIVPNVELIVQRTTETDANVVRREHDEQHEVSAQLWLSLFSSLAATAAEKEASNAVHAHIAEQFVDEKR